jgi:hypothetical protein
MFGVLTLSFGVTLTYSMETCQLANVTLLQEKITDYCLQQASGNYGP